MSMVQTTSQVLKPQVHPMLPQNGVAEGSLQCNSPPIAAASTSPPQLHRAVPTLGAVNGNKPRPMGILCKGGRNTTNHRNNSDDDFDVESSDDSPPSTPDSQESLVGDGRDDVVDAETKGLIKRFLTDFTGLSTPSWNESKAHSTMKRVVAKILEKHKYKYNGIINKLSLDDRGDNVSFVSEVAKSLFSDGTTNWGRVASLVAFGAIVSQHLEEKGRAHCVEPVAEEISSYLLSHQRNWLVKNNSWDGFVQFFREVDPESTLRNTLMAFAGVAGIGATLALLISTHIAEGLAHLHPAPPCHNLLSCGTWRLHLPTQPLISHLTSAQIQTNTRRTRRTQTTAKGHRRDHNTPLPSPSTFERQCYQTSQSRGNRILLPARVGDKENAMALM